MAYSKKTLADLQISLADRHDSGVLPTASATLAFWTRLINKGQAYCADRLGLSKQTDLTTVSGTIALPDDFIKINQVYKGDIEYSQISNSDIDDKAIGQTYWISGNHVDGFFLNSPEDETLTVDYVFRPAEMVNTTDVCVIPDPECVSLFAYSELRRSETDPIGDADLAREECEARLLELIDAQTTNDAFAGFTIQD